MMHGSGLVLVASVLLIATGSGLDQIPLKQQNNRSTRYQQSRSEAYDTCEQLRL